MESTKNDMFLISCLHSKGWNCHGGFNPFAKRHSFCSQHQSEQTQEKTILSAIYTYSIQSLYSVDISSYNASLPPIDNSQAASRQSITSQSSPKASKISSRRSNGRFSGLRWSVACRNVSRDHHGGWLFGRGLRNKEKVDEGNYRRIVGNFEGLLWVK